KSRQEQARAGKSRQEQARAGKSRQEQARAGGRERPESSRQARPLVGWNSRDLAQWRRPEYGSPP
ncbi:hypothetical protein ACUNV4_22750, partial [Granulosicoccus sp. 3-233]|uniref:hypothetical protein n=1 Tax=Granulosicoccus sp. 3-233 TaxID=3417969 RepID=UPI003D340EF6